MKQLLVDTQFFQLKPQSLTEGKTSPRGNLIVEGLLATAEEKNGNGRYYRRELWEREMKKYSQLVKENRALGELDHPDSQIVNLRNVSHNITEYWWNGDKIFGKIEILPTPSGNILKTLFENGVTVGVSSRGMGSLKQIGETLEVQDDFELVAWDFVSNPSNQGSFMKPTNLNESYNYTQSPHNEKIHRLITDLICNMGGVCKL